MIVHAGLSGLECEPSFFDYDDIAIGRLIALNCERSTNSKMNLSHIISITLYILISVYSNMYKVF